MVGGAGCDGGVVWVGGGGRRCRVWGLVMGFPLVAVGGGTRGRVCWQGDRNQSAAGGLRVVRRWPGLGGGGGGGVVWGWHCGCRGVRGWVLRWLGVWASRWVVWALRVRAVRIFTWLVLCFGVFLCEGISQDLKALNLRESPLVGR